MEREYKEEFMECRAGCAACCIAISISSPIPGMPDGKPAGIKCVQLDSRGMCKIFGKPERPKICSAFKAEKAICGSTRNEALSNIAYLEGINPLGLLDVLEQ